MKKIIRVSALALSLVAVLAAAVLFGVTHRPADEASVRLEQVETAALRQGSRGEDVKTVQTKLKRWGYYGGSVDGIYGAQT